MPVSLLAVLGLACVLRMWLEDSNWHVPAMVLYFCGVEMAFFPLARYTLPVMPLVMLIAAVGARWLL